MFARGPIAGATPKADALKHYPKAYAHHWADGWAIYDGSKVNKCIGSGRSAVKAWESVNAPNNNPKGK